MDLQSLIIPTTDNVLKSKSDHIDLQSLIVPSSTDSSINGGVDTFTYQSINGGVVTSINTSKNVNENTNTNESTNKGTNEEIRNIIETATTGDEGKAWEDDIDDGDITGGYLTGGNEVIGGESEFSINNIILSYDIINDEFLSKRKDLIENDKDNYSKMREKYIYKLMDIFRLNCDTIQEFDKELHELFILDDYSLLKVLFDRFKIKQKNLIKIVKEVNNKINSKYFQNKIQLVDNENYNEVLQQFVRLFENIPKAEFTLSKIEIVEDKAICEELINSVNESKVIDTSCEKCIYNRIYMYVEYLYNKIKKLKNKFIKLEEDVLLIVKYFDDLDL